MDVSDRSLQAMLTQEAKITSACSLSEVIFAFGGFVSALGRRDCSIPPPNEEKRRGRVSYEFAMKMLNGAYQVFRSGKVE